MSKYIFSPFQILRRLGFSISFVMQLDMHLDIHYVWMYSKINVFHKAKKSYIMWNEGGSF